MLPVTYAVSLLGGIWHGEGWRAHLDDVAELSLTDTVFRAIAVRVLRWE